jgi:glutamyl-tRNA reductase
MIFRSTSPASTASLFVVGLSYRTAPVGLREQLAITAPEGRCLGCRMLTQGGLREGVWLSTCNRVELYGVMSRGESNPEEILGRVLPGARAAAPHLYHHRGAQAVRHLFDVASGLDSMVLGETEITGQVKQAYETARAAGHTGLLLNRLFQKALQTAKAVRSQTRIGCGATSVGSVAVEMVEKIFGAHLGLRGVLVIGAGKMGESCLRHLAKKGARSILIANRSAARAEELARAVGGRAVPFDALERALAGVDIVISSTGCPHTILDTPTVERAMRVRRQRPLCLIDIAVPLDIEASVQHLPNVYLHNIDDLEAVVAENVRLREHELARCQSIITAQASALVLQLEAPRHRAAPPQPAPSDLWAGAGTPAYAT